MASNRDIFLDRQLPAPLHWSAVVARGEFLHRVLIGYRSQRSLRQRLDGREEIRRDSSSENTRVLAQLRDYTLGQHKTLESLPIDWTGWTPFQRDILRRCCRVDYGSTLTYGKLAASAGYPRAARAAGSVMAKNRLPILIPCHRIVPSGAGRFGRYSTPGGTATKRALLELEQRH